MNHTRAMAWDVDGTLVDSEPLHLRALQSVCDANGVDITDYGDTPFVGVAIGDVWRLLATRFESKFVQQADNAEGEFRRAVTQYYLKHSSEVRVLPGARQALEHLSSLGVSLAAVSSSERPIVLANLRTIGVLDLFQVVVSLDDLAQGDQRLNDLRDFQQWWASSGSQSCPTQHEITELATNGENE